MFRPQDQDIHRHKDLLDDIVTRIKDAEGPVFIGKVKSHIGIVGNERADETAVKVAKGRTDPDDCEEYWEVSNKRRYMYWPHHVTQETKRVRTYEQGQPVWKETSVTRKRPLQDLKQDTHELGRKRRRLGRANRNTIRFEAWNDVQADLHEATYHVENSTHVQAKERLTAKKYRTGCLYNRSLAHMFKKADSPNCLMCGQRDGGHHIASGCPGHTKMYVHRHDKAVRHIVTAIQRGRRGGFLVSMDAGSADRCEADGIAAVPRNIPAEALPKNMPTQVVDAVTKHSRPDAFLVRPPEANRGRYEYIILEVKYCRDTDPAGRQLERAEQQHEALAAAIREADPRAQVTYVPVMLGVAGAIYKQHTIEQLKKVGVVEGPLKTLARKLNVHAVKMLHWIYQNRTKQERKKFPRDFRNYRSKKRKS